MDKIKAGNGTKSEVTVAFLNRVVMAGYIEKGTFEKRFKGGSLKIFCGEALKAEEMAKANGTLVGGWLVASSRTKWGRGKKVSYGIREIIEGEDNIGLCKPL